MTAITALRLSALCLGVALAAPLAAQDFDPTMGESVCLLQDLARPVTGREDPKLLAATARKVLELAAEQVPGRRVHVFTCIGIGHACADPPPKALPALDARSPQLQPASACRLNHAITERATGRTASLLRLDTIERRGRDFARLDASYFLDPDSGAGWRCDATRIGGQWIVGPCRLTWTL